MYSNIYWFFPFYIFLCEIRYIDSIINNMFFVLKIFIWKHDKKKNWKKNQQPCIMHTLQQNFLLFVGLCWQPFCRSFSIHTYIHIYMFFRTKAAATVQKLLPHLMWTNNGGVRLLSEFCVICNKFFFFLINYWVYLNFFFFYF